MGTWPLFAVFLAGCIGKADKHDFDSNENGLNESGSEDSDDSADSGESGEVEADLGGTVTVQLYTAGDDGERQLVSWEDSTCEGVYSFGKVFIAAYRVNDAGERHYIAQTTIDSPTTAGDAYNLPLNMEQAGEIYLYAAVDYWGDRVIGSSDPVGNYPTAISVADGDVINGLDMTVLVPECYGGGGGCDTMSVSGDVVITVAYAGGETVVLLVNENGEGPIGNYLTWDTPTSVGGGAEAPYTLTACDGVGEAHLVGCWDSNGNELADPLDRWGTYYEEPDVDANPVTLGSSNIANKNVQIPLGDFPGVSVVPFVTLSGTIVMPDSMTFGESEGATLYVAAMKYRPSGDVAVSDFEEVAYSTESWEIGDISSETSVDFAINTPGNTIVYLWSYLDQEGDGMVNGPDEYLSAGGGETSGRIPTGTTDSDGYELLLAVHE